MCLLNIPQMFFCFWYVPVGIFKNDGPFDVMIDISKIQQLHTIPSETEVCYCARLCEHSSYYICYYFNI